MTGFGRSEGQSGNTAWVWELRAVNGKGLDVRLRMPNGFDQLEPSVRKLCGQHLSRGNIQASLSVLGLDTATVPTINDAALDSVLAALDVVTAKTATSPSTAAEILSLRGVLELREASRDDRETEALNAAVLDGLVLALKSLNEHRIQEGAALEDLLRGHLDEIERLTQKAEDDPARTPEAIAKRLNEQLARMGDTAASIDSERLYQEVALLATKADIREELDRLSAHVQAVRELLNQGSPLGRKLEFIAQEFNRESNTLCSKSNAVSITEIGLELKVVIDQFREQILNVE